jgi:hypothetical protein
LFGIIKPISSPDIIQPDQSNYLFISLSSLIAGVIVTVLSSKKAN